MSTLRYRPKIFGKHNLKGFVPMTRSQLAVASKMFPGCSSAQLTESELQQVFASDVKTKEGKVAFMQQVKTYPLLSTERCPQCSLEEMNIHKINDLGYFCECKHCKVSYSTKDYKYLLKNFKKLKKTEKTD